VLIAKGFANIGIAEVNARESGAGDECASAKIVATESDAVKYGVFLGRLATIGGDRPRRLEMYGRSPRRSLADRTWPQQRG